MSSLAFAGAKLKLGWPVIEERLSVIREILTEIVPITSDSHVKAVALSKEYGFFIYDAMLIACALSAGCGKIITEDMQPGHEIEGLTIWNPFAD